LDKQLFNSPADQSP